MAWLHAKPKPDPRTKRAQLGSDAATLSRFDQYKKTGATPPMPPNPMPHIVAWLIEIGLTEAAGMGTAALSWREISAWCERTGVDLPPWEGRLIRSLSVAYVAESHRAELETCPPPWRAPVTQREIDTETARLEQLLG